MNQYTSRTQEEKDFIEEFYPKEGAEFCADALNLDISKIRNYLRRHPIKCLDGVWDRIQRRNARERAKNYQFNPDHFLNITHPSIAYILGLAWGDGSINEKRHTFSITLVKEDMDTIFNQISSLGEWKSSLYQGSGNRKLKQVIALNNVIIETFLRENDYHLKSGYSADKILNKIPKHLHPLFLRGFLDADGSIYVGKKGSQVQFSSVYDQDWTFMEKIMNELDIFFSINKRVERKGRCSTFSIWRLEDKIKLLNYIYQTYPIDNCGFPRKYEKAKELFRKYNRSYDSISNKSAIIQ